MAQAQADALSLLQAYLQQVPSQAQPAQPMGDPFAGLGGLGAPAVAGAGAPMNGGTNGLMSWLYSLFGGGAGGGNAMAGPADRVVGMARGPASNWGAPMAPNLDPGIGFLPSADPALPALRPDNRDVVINPYREMPAPISLSPANPAAGWGTGVAPWWRS
jgi:hypothetical protein